MHFICCAICGRWGTRGFREHGGDGKERVCGNDRACRRRAERQGYPWPSPTLNLLGFGREDLPARPVSQRVRRR